jgi:SNF2 family DNA or RNA helicase
VIRTVGTLRLDQRERAWVVDCEPHVKIRLKRVFAKLAKSSHGTLRLSDTAENAADLRWFMERYPLDVAPADLEHLDRRVADHVDRAAQIANVLADGYVPPAFPLALPAREYQRIAADLVLRSGGTLIADDVGIGKTVTGICTLTDPRTLPALVVTLTHLPRQWQAEINRFAPHLRVHILKSGKPYDIAAAMRGRRRADRTAMLPGLNAFPDVLISNYHKLSGWADTLGGQVRSVIFDEVQELRRCDSAKYSAAGHIARGASFRTGLSATPIYNYGGEMFAVLDAIRPGALGTREEFIREWCGEGGQPDRASVKDPKAFGTYLRSEGLMLRRTRADVGRELPELTKVTHHIDADPEELERVQGSAAELARIILTQGGLERGAQFRAAEELSYLLRQATGIAKATFVAEFVRLLVESGEQVVLYGWHRAVYDVWAERLADLKPAFFTGEESPTQKADAATRFIRGDAKVLVMSLRAGAGLDGLQGHCRTMVFGELDWSPGVHEQAIGRVHRDGQPDKVVAYFLVADSGSDPVVADVLGLKRQQIEGLRDPHADLIERLDTGGGHITRLAAAYLRERGIAAPSVVDAPAAATGTEG